MTAQNEQTTPQTTLQTGDFVRAEAAPMLGIGIVDAVGPARDPISCFHVQTGDPIAAIHWPKPNGHEIGIRNLWPIDRLTVVLTRRQYIDFTAALARAGEYARNGRTAYEVWRMSDGTFDVAWIRSRVRPSCCPVWATVRAPDGRDGIAETIYHRPAVEAGFTN